MGKEEFKEFVKTKPELVDYVENNTMTWQKFYELYDLYGTDSTIWEKYPPTQKAKVSDFITKIDENQIKKHIENAQKALEVISELTTKTKEETDIVKPIVERPLTKFFGE